MIFVHEIKNDNKKLKKSEKMEQPSVHWRRLHTVNTFCFDIKLYLWLFLEEIKKGAKSTIGPVYVLS